MQVRVLLFGILKDLVGRGADTITLPERATAGDVLVHYGQDLAGKEPLLASVAISVNQEYVSSDRELHSGDEVALLPPVSGGGPVAAPLVRLQRERIVPHDVVPPLERPEDGAVVIFDGIVRNNSRGRRTLYLDYEAYEEMALNQLRDLASQASEQFAIRNVALVHRLGRIEIGESSVLIAVFSAHRAAAFDACRWLIDALKRSVPIWKKEFFEDGAVWADGEPFPDQIRAGTNRGSPASK
jgi:molybdopterin synthase catalytic subunit/molybdopterin converting factor small subunit